MLYDTVDDVCLGAPATGGNSETSYLSVDDGDDGATCPSSDSVASNADDSTGCRGKVVDGYPFSVGGGDGESYSAVAALGYS